MWKKEAEQWLLAIVAVTLMFAWFYNVLSTDVAFLKVLNVLGGVGALWGYNYYLKKENVL